MAKAALFLILVVSAAPVLAQRAQAEMRCTLTDTDFVYDCVFFLEKAGEPLSGVTITIGADMPSMPMAHNVKPVKARPGTTPGEYLARLDLDMPGEWALRLRLSGPVRDVVVLRYSFKPRS